MPPIQVQLLHAEVSVHPISVHLGGLRRNVATHNIGQQAGERIAGCLHFYLQKCSCARTMHRFTRFQYILEDCDGVS